MNQPIDVELFLSQLADDDRLACELADLATTDEVLTDLEPTPEPDLLDRLVSRAVIVALECQLRGLSPVHDGEQYAAELRASFAEVDIPAPYVPQPGDDELLRMMERKLWDL
jgi:hypothetical protein